MSRRWIIIIVIIVLLVVAGGFFVQSQGGISAIFGGEDADATPTPLPAVQSTPDIIVDAVVVPVRYADLSFSTSGTVDEILITEGDAVQAGDILARLDNERQVIAIAQAEARVRSVQARIDQLEAGSRPEEIAAAQAAVDVSKANLANLVEGSRPEDIAAAEAALDAAEANLVKVLEGADEAELIAARADLSNAEAALRQAQAAYDDVKWRSDVAALPQAAELQRATNNYEAAKARYDLLIEGAEANEIAAAQAEVEQARATLDKARAPATDSEIAAAEADVRRAEAELDLRKAGSRVEEIAAAKAELTEAQATLMQRQVELNDTELRAPFAGTVASLQIEAGEQVGAGVTAVQLADLSEWRIETDDLTEINVVYVQEGDAVEIAVDALPELALTGTVIRIKPLGENKQGDITYTATIVPDRHDDRLRWNMSASVTIQTEDTVAER